MIDISAMIIGQALGVLLWSLLLNAPILRWRARELRNWSIGYKDAYIISIKAGFVSFVTADVAVLAAALSGSADEELLKSVGLLFGLVTWWFAHSSGLLKLAGQSVLLTVKDARSISTSVFGHLLVGAIVLSLGLLLIVSLVSLLT